MRQHLRRLAAGLAGLVFGTGLLLSGMTSPAKVLGFLDVAGRWDPSLAFVMGGGLLVAAPLYAWAARRPCAWDGSAADLPVSSGIDGRLIAGAAIFGVGWGLAGICPGPALVDLAIAPARFAPFVIALAAGLVLAAIIGKRCPA